MRRAVSNKNPYLTGKDIILRVARQRSSWKKIFGLCMFLLIGEGISSQNIFEKFKDWAEIDLSTKEEFSSQTKKSGLTLIPYPNLSFSSDMGLQLGASAELVDFGKGEYYPSYRHRMFAQVSYFTSDSWLYRFFYDSQHLIKGIRTTFDFTLIPQPNLQFYGYNGYEAPLNEGFQDSFNQIDRNLSRVTLDFEGKIFRTLKWYAGLTALRYDISSPTVDAQGNPVFSLYNLYVQNNLIHEEEMNGGEHLYFKAGLIYDSRDSEADTRKGTRGELFLAYTPDFIRRGGYSHLKLSFVHSSFRPLIEDRLILATRIGYHGTVFGGRVPWYLQSNINTIFPRKLTSEGLGGITTLRGVLTNRVVGDGVAWCNIEMRCRLINATAFKHQMYLAANPFIDFGGVVQRYRGDEMVAAGKSTYGEYIYKDQPERLHFSSGIGLKLVIDRNIVFSGEMGKAFNAQDGNAWQFFFGSNYIF